jgi:O-antigen/teichoic acid export membrane protein
MALSVKQLFGNSATYAVGVVMRNVSSLVMLPIYTRHLTPSDYGTIELLGMVIDFVAIFIGLQISSAVYRYYGLATTETEKKSVISSAMAFMISTYAVGIAIVWLLSPAISVRVFGAPGFEHLISLFSLTLLLSALSEVPMTYVRALERPWLFVGLSALQLTLQIVCNVWFVVVQQLGVIGVVYSSLLARLIFALVVSVFALSRTGFGISRSMLKSLAAFSIPIMLGSLATFYMTSIDKYLLRHLSGLASVGVYTLGYKFAMVLTGLVAMPFLSAWEPMRYKLLAAPDAQQQFARVLRLYTVVLSAVWLCLAMFSEDVLKIMSKPDFWAAAEVTPWIVLAYVFHCWTDYTNFGIMLSGKTYYFTVASVLGGVTTTILCWLLIPHFGFVGAGMAAASAFFVRFLWVYRGSQLHYRIPFNWTAIGSAPALAILFYVLSRFAPDTVLLSLLCKGAIFLGFTAVLWRLPILQQEDRNLVFNAWNAAFGPKKLVGPEAAAKRD